MRKPRFKPDEVVVAITSFVTGANFVCHRGTRLRADHAAVQAAPHLFLPDASSDDEIAAAAAALEPDPVDHAPAGPRVLEPLRDEDALAVLEPLTVNVVGGLMALSPGDRVDGRSASIMELRKQHPRAFKAWPKAKAKA